LFLNKKDEYHAVIKLLENMQQPKHTFCHGDLTPDNTVVDRKGYVNLIDPLNVTYSSFELDIAKLNSWALRNNENDIVVNTLVVSETIRTLKYAPDELYFKLRDKCLNYLRV
jgi:thiamine kinase-like enzyme